MKPTDSIKNYGPRSGPCTFLPSAAAILTLLLLTANRSFAGSATWKANPGSGTWNTAANWTPATIPNGAADTATFAFSGTKNVFFSADTEVNGIVFNTGASPFTLINQAPTVTISGKGITNNSGIVQNFTAGPGEIIFINSATAGSLTSFSNTGAIAFADGSSAGNATFTNEGELTFHNTSTAAMRLLLTKVARPPEQVARSSHSTQHRLRAAPWSPLTAVRSAERSTPKRFFAARRATPPS